MKKGLMACGLYNRNYTIQVYKTVSFVAEANRGIIVTQSR